MTSTVSLSWVSYSALVAQTVKNLPAMRETWVRSLGWEDPLDGRGYGNPPQYPCLQNPMDRGTCGLQSMESQRVRHDWLTHNTQLFINIEQSVQAGFRKGRGTRDQIANIRWIMEKARAFQKNSYFCFIDYAKAFDCVDHNKLWKILKEMRIPDHLTCLLRNLYAGQEAIVRTGPGTTDWFQIGKGVHQGCMYIVTLLI